MTLHIFTSSSFYAVIVQALIGQRLRYYPHFYLVLSGAGDRGEK